MASVAYAVCPACPTNITTGTATLNSSSGTVTFSIPQTHLLMGVGMEVSYNDGTAKKGYIATKVSTSVWTWTTATGGAPADCTGATITAITAPYASMSAAEAGCNDANHTNNVNITAAGANLNLLIPCYCEQTNLTADTTACTWNAITGDLTHRVYVYSPTNTSTECNCPMFPTAPKYDAGKYRNIINTTNITISTTAPYICMYHLQIYNTATTNSLGVTITMAANETMDVYDNIIITTYPTLGTTYSIGLNVNGTTPSTIYIYNNITFVVGTRIGTWGTWGGMTFQSATTTAYVYSNTIYGYRAPLARTACTVYALNNAYIGNYNNISGTVTKNYDVYDVDASETNGYLTTQPDSGLFLDAFTSSPLYWDWTPKFRSHLIDRGSGLGAPYNIDIIGNTRPHDSIYTCGAVEYTADTEDQINPIYDPISIYDYTQFGVPISYAVPDGKFKKRDRHKINTRQRRGT